jgi:hypothetical protein
MNPLRKLSDQELEARLKDLVSKERKLLHVILEHIKEVDTRKLYLERAYSSIYEYLVKELNYSGSAAMRRLEAARLLREVPALSEEIHKGSLNLSQIGELSRAIKEKEKVVGEKVSALQKAELVAMISGKTTQETQKELAMALEIQPKEFDLQRTQKDESVRLEFTVSKELFEKLQQCKDLAAHTLSQNNQDSSWASVLEVVANSYLAKKKELKTEGNNKLNPVTTASVVKVNKTLTPKVKRQVYRRDQCCQYKDPLTGRKCESTFAPQTDHKTSRWAGGGHSLKNLQLLCANHNRYKYQKEAQLRLV